MRISPASFECKGKADNLQLYCISLRIWWDRGTDRQYTDANSRKCRKLLILQAYRINHRHFMSIEERILSERGIKPTANRILILRELLNSSGPMSMSELETALETIDKSVVFRNLVLFREHHLLHQIQAGEEVKYEFCACECADEDGAVDEDEHVHFYCENCHKTICLNDLPIPRVELPSGYSISEINYVVSGLCPDCASKR